MGAAQVTRLAWLWTALALGAWLFLAGLAAWMWAVGR